VRLLELAQNAQPLFAKQPPPQKRRLLDFLVSNCTWRDGELTATFRQPFDMLAETTAAASRSAAMIDVATAKSEIWLPGPDSNQRQSG
jgi:site-specific DNA recombinase